MTQLFQKAKFLTHRSSNIEVNIVNTPEYKKRSLRHLRSNIWNLLPEALKKKASLSKFKKHVNQWFVLKCKFNLCLHLDVISNKKLSKFKKRQHDLGFDLFLSKTSLSFSILCFQYF